MLTRQWCVKFKIQESGQNIRFFFLFVFLGSLGGDLGDKSIRELHREDVPPGSPLKPGEKITADEQVEFICMWKGSDSGFDSSESSDNLFSDRETTSKSKRYLSFHFLSENKNKRALSNGITLRGISACHWMLVTG